MHTLRLLGGLSLDTPEGSLVGRAAQPRRLAMLALLALSPSGALRRDRLIGYLWPERDEEQARRLLSVSLYELRKALGEEALTGGGEEISLDAARVETDALAFAAAVRAEAWEEAVELYRGPFLDGVYVADAAEFERWAESERDRLHRLHLQALEALARQRQEAGDLATAVAVWRRLAAADPFSARGALGLMQALAAAGDRAAALQHARTFEILLREEFDTEPDAEIVALAGRLRTQPAAAAPAPVPVPPPAPVPPGAEAVADSQPAPAPDTPPEVDAAAPAGPRRRALRLPNLAVTVAVVVVLFAWLGRERPVASSVPAPQVLAVLPFTNLSAESDEYVSDGMTEELIVALGRIDGLRLVPRTSVFAFKGRHQDVREIGRELGADYLLEGGVKRSGSRLRVTVSLLRSADGHVLWSRPYDHELGDIFSVYDAIARSVVEALRVQLGGHSGVRLVQASTDDVEAYELYLQGRTDWYHRDPKRMQRALARFTEAVRRDPEYAVARTAIADVYNTLGAYHYSVLPPGEAYPRALEAARSALALNPELAQAHAALANTLMNYERDFAGAEAAFRRAIDLDPSYPESHHWYSLLLVGLGRADEALAQVRLAGEIDPRNPVMTTALARHYYFTRDYDQAVRHYRRALDEDSSFVTARTGLGLVYAQMDGRLADAIAEFEAAARALGGREPVLLGLLGYAYGRGGRTGEARETLRQLHEQAGRRYVAPDFFVLVHLGLGENELAFEWLQRAFDNRSNAIVYLNVEPVLDPLRDDPRFARMVQAAGLASGRRALRQQAR